MRKHRFYLPIPLALKQNITLDRDLSHHINRVLRMQPADQIFIFNNTGNEFTGYITDIDRNSVTVQIIAANSVAIESPFKIHLGQVIGKGEKMDLVIQKTTELGITSITPLYSEHGIVKQVADRTDNKVEHWQRIAIAASCQSWRTVIPTINPPQKLQDWVNTNNTKHKIVLHPNASAKHLRDLSLANEITILIGPEGGLSENEVTLAINNGFTTISLGSRILRTETAGIVSVAILQALFGDL